MGQLIDALRRIPTAAVSAEANGPGTGPSVPFNGLNPVQQTQVARDRLKAFAGRGGLRPSAARASDGCRHRRKSWRRKPPLNAEWH